MLLQNRFTLGPFETNAYLLIDRATRETAVIDVGFDADRIAQALDEAGVVVRYLLNTHAHYDHIAAMRTLQARVGGTYWLHPADRFLADGITTQGAAMGLPAAVAPDEIHDLFDGQTLTLGANTLSVIHTPGHSPGSVTFRCLDDLWVGDILFAGSIGRTDLPGGSFETLRSSIRGRLFPLGDALSVHPGHGPSTTIGDERRTNAFVGDGADLA
ncbi:MAG: MBL fold metallo-hydrolase [Candidatus Eisenbacteria bacterium]|uniref:MBL fold metallo-hydrolase n=1 Tax=Eiseniibacteriota bacterium TaxID=2212470 RepID=A0A849SIZ1_UNCEI|nr:MBL fold metallo-hydrolase [Candidatus Eisenbacteria bacterium]